MRTCLIASLWVCTLVIPAAVCAQTPLAPASQVQAAPNGAGPQRSSLKEGQLVETRLPEKRDDNPLFPEQTRAPYHSSAPFRVTTLIDNLLQRALQNDFRRLGRSALLVSHESRRNHGVHHSVLRPFARAHGHVSGRLQAGREALREARLYHR